MRTQRESQKLKAAIYVRVSTNIQTENTSLDTQLERCERWCELNGCDVYEIYRDEGISGAKDEERRAFTALKEDARQGKFQTVVCAHLDRFARNLRILLEAIAELDEVGVDFVCTEQAIDTTKKGFGKVFLHLLGVLAEWERTILAERTMAGKVHNVKAGKFIGGQMPLGYEHSTDGKVIINKEESNVVTHIFNLAENNGTMAIARILNSDGTPHHRTKIQFPTHQSRHCERYKKQKYSRSCKVSSAWKNFELCEACFEYYKGNLLPPVAWSNSVLKTILHHKKYIGEVTWGRAEGTNNALKIIESEQFNKIQKRMKKFAQTPSRSKSSPHLLTGGILKCFCGANFICLSKKDAYWYQCSARRNKKTCRQKMFRRKKLDNQIIESVQMFLNKKKINLSGHIGKTEEAKRKKKIEDNIKFAQKAMKLHNKNLKRILDRYVYSDEADHKNLSAMLNKEAEKEKRKLAIGRHCLSEWQTIEKLEADEAYRKAVDKITKTQRSDQFKVLMHHLGNDIRKNLLKRFIEKIIVNEDLSIRIIWQNLANITS